MPQGNNPDGSNGNTNQNSNPDDNTKNPNPNPGDGGEGQGASGGDGAGPGDQNPNPNPGDGDFDDSTLDEKTQKYIQSLRKENAKYRTSAKDTNSRFERLEAEQAKRDKALKAALGLSEDDETPIEDRFEASQSENAILAFQNETLKLALDNGITGDGVEYFQFLIGNAVNGLEEGQELSEESIEGLVNKAKSAGGTASHGGGGSTSVGKGTNGNGQGGDPNPSTGNDTLSVQDFANMTFSQKGALFGKNPDLYKKLNAEATAKGLL